MTYVVKICWGQLFFGVVGRGGGALHMFKEPLHMFKFSTGLGAGRICTPPPLIKVEVVEAKPAVPRVRLPKRNKWELLGPPPPSTEAICLSTIHAF